MENIARSLIIGGLVLIVLGSLVFVLARNGVQLGRLPGDIRIQTENFTCLFPVVTMIIVSIVATILLNLIIRIINR